MKKKIIIIINKPHQTIRLMSKIHCLFVFCLIARSVSVAYCTYVLIIRIYISINLAIRKKSRCHNLFINYDYYTLNLITTHWYFSAFSTHKKYSRTESILIHKYKMYFLVANVPTDNFYSISSALTLEENYQAQADDAKRKKELIVSDAFERGDSLDFSKKWNVYFPNDNYIHLHATPFLLPIS